MATLSDMTRLAGGFGQWVGQHIEWLTTLASLLNLLGYVGFSTMKVQG
jgi:hypothetical protein